MIELTDEQRTAILQIGSTASIFEVVQAEVMEQLMGLGLVYKRHDGNLDFTESGEAVYKSLRKRDDNE